MRIVVISELLNLKPNIMHLRQTLSEVPREPKFGPPVLLAKVKQKIETFVRGGLVDSFCKDEEIKDFGDEHMHWRDYGLQTLISAEAVELLQPMPVVSLSALSAADKLGTAEVKIGRIIETSKSVEPVKESAETADTKTE